MFRILNPLLFLYGLLFNSILITFAVAPNNCPLPDECRLETIKRLFADSKHFVILCDIKNDAFEFKIKETVGEKSCNLTNVIMFNWSSNKLITLEKKFNFTSVIRYFNRSIYVHFWNLKGFETNILEDNKHSFENRISISISLSDIRLDFYRNKKRMESCKDFDFDFTDSNLTQFQSIFQIGSDHFEKVVLKNVEYQQKTCPLVFLNSKIDMISIFDLVNTFYKKNVLSFSNETTFTRLNSTIGKLTLNSVHDINVDLELVNPFVFANISKMTIMTGSLNSIDGEIFK